MALGEQLRNARLRMNLTASQVAAGTRMKVQMVEQIEHEDFHQVAAPIYGKGFIKLYAEYVRLDPKPLIDEYMFRFVDHVPSVVSKTELPKEEGGSGIPTVLKNMEAPEELESAEDEISPIEEEVSVKPVKIERPKEITKPASVNDVPQIPKMETSENVKPAQPAAPERDEKSEEFGTAEMPDLFDAANVSRQQAPMTLGDEAGVEMNQQPVEAKIEEPEQQVPLMDIISDVCESGLKKFGDLIVFVKDKIFSLWEAPDKAGITQKPVKDEASKEEKIPTKMDFFENPMIMVSSAVVIIAVVISLILMNRKPSIEVPVEGEGSGELELVEEPPPPYVD